jgi:hypothetical protein
VQPRRPSPDPLPSVAALAAKLRRQPIGVVVAGICRDLGITPNHRLWQELSEVVAAHGGDLAELRQEIEERCPPEYWPPAGPGAGESLFKLGPAAVIAAAEQ